MVQRLEHWAATRPTAPVYRYLPDGEHETESLTYLELDAWARAVATRLLDLRAGGGRVLLLLPQDLQFIKAFYGCLYAGAAAVPAMLPRPGRSLSQTLSILRVAEPDVVLTTASALPRLQTELTDAAPHARWLCIEDIAEPGDCAVDIAAPPRDPHSAAIIQFTSGSTGAPKGVVISQRNLVSNQEAIRQAFGHTSDLIVGGWLPMYHDMGLIGVVLQTAYCGGVSALMPPLAFLQNPLRWLRMVSRYRIMTTGGPNFGYELCAEKAQRLASEDLDLSCWSLAFTGSEPIRRSTLTKFCSRFERFGFRSSAIYPCYGLAEATLFVTGPAHSSTGGQTSWNDVGVEHDSTERSAVPCGHAWCGTQVEIVDPETRQRLSDAQIGEIWIRGDSVSSGYFRNPALTEQVFHGRLADPAERPFLRTGDLGFKQGDTLYVTGRIKDMIIVRGQNHYPQDIEHTVESCSELGRQQACVAFALQIDGAEYLVIVQELRRGASGESHQQLPAQISQRVVEEHGLKPYRIALVPPGSVPRTTSGKLRRAECRQMFERGEFAPWVVQ